MVSHKSEGSLIVLFMDVTRLISNLLTYSTPAVYCIQKASNGIDADTNRDGKIDDKELDSAMEAFLAGPEQEPEPETEGYLHEPAFDMPASFTIGMGVYDFIDNFEDYNYNIDNEDIQNYDFTIYDAAIYDNILSSSKNKLLVIFYKSKDTNLINSTHHKHDIFWFNSSIIRTVNPEYNQTLAIINITPVIGDNNNISKQIGFATARACISNINDYIVEDFDNGYYCDVIGFEFSNEDYLYNPNIQLEFSYQDYIGPYQTHYINLNLDADNK